MHLKLEGLLRISWKDIRLMHRDKLTDCLKMSIKTKVKFHHKTTKQIKIMQGLPSLSIWSVSVTSPTAIPVVTVLRSTILAIPHNNSLINKTMNPTLKKAARTKFPSTQTT
jgi:hypothetical protein